MKNPVNYFDVVIIGAGPAGLSAGMSLLQRGYKFAIYDSGLPLKERSNNKANQLIQGEGGAGLYSDGKVSFFPSATALWSLRDQEILRESYLWFSGVFQKSGIIIPQFPDVIKLDNKNLHEVYNKKYPSYYINFNARKEIISSFFEKLKNNINFSSQIVSLVEANNEFDIYIENHTGTHVIRSRCIIFAGGRFGAIDLRRMIPALPLKFQRFEVGVRLEQPNSEWFYSQYESTDIKLIQQISADREWRTFCTCRQGRVLKTKWNGISTFSGTADCGKTLYSNIGINIRFKCVPKDTTLLSEIYTLLSGDKELFSVTLQEYIETEKIMLGEKLDKIFRKKFSETFQKNFGKSKIYGPCIEGIGYYPEISGALKVNSRNIFVAGDATGLFRGIMPAMVSGFYCGRQIDNIINKTKINSNFYIKQSSSEPMSIVFTAQSKEFFYCRDAICEYVMKQGKLPINPFRAFDYFLSDRVDRNIVRQANNQLVAIADELWIFGVVSDGVLFEVYRARQLNKPVRFFTISANTDDIYEITADKVKFDPEVHSRGIRRDVLVGLLDDSLLIKKNPYQLGLPYANTAKQE